MTDAVVADYARLAEGVYLEGLAYDFGRDVIWYSDVIKGGIHGVRPDGKRYGAFNLARMWTGGVMMNADGAVFSSGQGGIMWHQPDSGQSGWLIDSIDGQPINGVNEMWPDGGGGLFFGTNDIEHVIAAKPTRPSALYRLTVDREVIKLADVSFSNGIAHDPARRKFYCCDSFAKAWVWDVNADLSLTNRQVLLDRDDCDGLAPVATPPGSTTQIRFGGADLRDVYINVVPADGGDSLKEGQPLNSPSYLYRGRADLPGMAVAPARFRLG